MIINTSLYVYSALDWLFKLDAFWVLEILMLSIKTTMKQTNI